MKFTVRVRDPRGKEKTEEMHAPSEKKARELYEMMGYVIVEVLKAEKESGMLDGIDPATIAALNTGGGHVPNMGTVGTKLPPPTQPQPRYKEYEDSGVKYRVELNSGKLQKQGWVKMSVDSLKNLAVEENGTIKNAHSLKLKLHSLEWVDL